MEGIEQLVANITGNAQRVIEDGRAYLVAPLSMIVPGVLPGSRGPLLYPEHEVQRKPGVWNNIPITLRHPIDPKTNEPLSADDKGVLERQGIGFIRNDRYDGRRIADGWFDEEKTKQIAPEVYNALIKNEPMEVSTGLRTSNMPAENGSTFNGKAYTHIATNYRPDHLAILPDQKGACNLNDGCGLNVNQAQDDANVDNVQPRSKKKGVYLKHSQGAGESEGDVHDAATAGATHNKDTINCGGEGGQPGPCDAGDAVKERAAPPVAGGGQKRDPKEEAQAKGSQTAAKKKTEDNRKRDAKLKAARDKQRAAKQTDNTETPMNREEIIEHLVVNCDCWKKEGGKDVLNKLDDAQLSSLYGQNIAAAAVKQAHGDLTVNSAAQVIESARIAANFDGDETNADDSSMVEEETPPAKKKGKKTMNELIANGLVADEDVESLQVLRDIVSDVRNAYVAQLTAGAKDKAAMVKVYNAMPIKDLKVLVAAMPEPKVQNNFQGNSYYGAAGGPAVTNASAKKPSALEVPVMNFEEEKKRSDAARSA